MPASLLDSLYYRDRYGSPAMRAVFDDTARIQAWLDVEAALARAQAETGLIPAAAAEAITAAARVENLDLAAMEADYDRTGFAIQPLIRQLAGLLAPEARAFLHWGATTQDILDTGLVLQMREGLDLLEGELDRALAALAALARNHRDTPMAGRSFLQQAAPISFGYKAAVWLDELMRQRDRLAGMRARALRLQCGGAVGTLAGMGDQALAVRAALARGLDLPAPEISWHNARDGWAECVFWLAAVSASLGRIATEIAQLMRSEIGELREPYAPGRGGSSAMPQKRNPVACPQVIAIAALLRDRPAAMLGAMVQEHERGIAAMPVEWLVMPEAFLLTAGAFAQLNPVLEGLEVDAARMRANLVADGGLMLAAGVMMALAPHLGSQPAHQAVGTASARVIEGGGSLRDALAASPSVTAHLDGPALEALFDPAAHLGMGGAMVDLVLARYDGLPRKA